MQKRGHVINAILLSIGLGFVLRPVGDPETFATVTEMFVPVLLGALFPDVDSVFGNHRATLHNLFVLGVIATYPLYFGNLHWVWVGVLSHYVLDVLGTTRGIALLYPLSDREFGIPIGVTVDSNFSDLFTLAVTALELAGAFALVQYGPELFARTTLPFGL